MSRVETWLQSRMYQSRTRAAPGQAEPGQVYSVLERNGRGRTRRIGIDQSQGRAGPDQVSSKQDSQGRSRSRANQVHGEEEARQRPGHGSEARTWKCKAREGHDSMMPKKDMTEFSKVGQAST